MATRTKSKAKAKPKTGSKAKTAGKNATDLLDRPVKVGNRRMGWVSDLIAETTRRLDLKYMALVPGASYRGFHDSLVNYLGNQNPQMVICLHEEHSVAIADGYAAVTDQPMAAALHTNVGLMHASMAIFNAWSNRNPMIIFGANGPIDAYKRRPWIDWIHSSKDHAQMVRQFLKWDDEPQSPQAVVESLLRANQITRSKPNGPVYICLDAGLQEAPLEKPVTIPDIERYQPALPPAAPRSSVQKVLKAIAKAKAPLLMVGRVSRSHTAWQQRVRLAEHLGAAVMTSMRVESAFPSKHPLHYASTCSRPGDEHKNLIKKADLILSLDWLDPAGFLRLCTGDVQTEDPTRATMIQCSLDQYLHNGWNMDYQALPAADINIMADPDMLVAQMLEELGVGANKSGKIKSRPAFAKLGHWTKSAAARAKRITDKPMRPIDLHITVSEFGRKRKNMSYLRLAGGFPGTLAYFDHPLNFFNADGGGGVGAGPGHSVGMALALQSEGRFPLAVLGDGDFLMGNNALWTASRMEIPLMIIVANNRSFYNDEAHQFYLAELRGRASENSWIGLKLDEPKPNIAGLARAQGFDAVGPVETAAELEAEMERGAKIVAAGGRFLIDAHISASDAIARRRADGGRGEFNKKK